MEHLPWTKEDIALFGDALYGLSYEDGLQELDELDRDYEESIEPSVPQHKETSSVAEPNAIDEFSTLFSDIDEVAAGYHETSYDDTPTIQNHHSYDADHPNNVSKDQTDKPLHDGTSAHISAEPSPTMSTHHEPAPNDEHWSWTGISGIDTTFNKAGAANSSMQAVDLPHNFGLPSLNTTGLPDSEQRELQPQASLPPLELTATPLVGDHNEVPSSEGKSSLMNEMRSEESDALSNYRKLEVGVPKLRFTSPSDTIEGDMEDTEASEAIKQNPQPELDLPVSNVQVSAPLISVHNELLKAPERVSRPVNRRFTRLAHQEAEIPAKRKKTARNTESGESLRSSTGNATKRRKTTAPNADDEASTPQIENLRNEGQKVVRRASVRDEVSRLTESRFLNGDARPQERSASRQLRSQKLENEIKQLTEDKKRPEEATKKRLEEETKAPNAGRSARDRQRSSAAHVKGFYKV